MTTSFMKTLPTKEKMSVTKTVTHLLHSFSQHILLNNRITYFYEFVKHFLAIAEKSTWKSKSFFCCKYSQQIFHRVINKKIGSNDTRDWVQILPAGRSEKIWTSGLLVPNQALYRTEPHPDNVRYYTTKLMECQGLSRKKTIHFRKKSAESSRRISFLKI